MNDYEYVIACKNNDNKAQLEFFKKYERFFGKMYSKLRSQLPNLTYDIQDYMQEAYFAFNDAIKYVDFAKIVEPPEDWSFIKILFVFTLSLNKKIRKDYWKQDDTHSLDFFSEESDNTIHFNALHKEDISFDLIMDKDEIKHFLTLLDGDEVVVIQKKLQIKADNTIPRLQDIGEEMGHNYSWAYRKFLSAKEKFYMYMYAYQ